MRVASRWSSRFDSTRVVQNESETSSGKRREEMNAINNSRSRDEELSARGAAGAEMKKRALPTVYTGRASGRGCKCRG